MDEIKIQDLEVYAYHGVFAREKKLGQMFLVNAGLSMDTRAAGRADDLGLSVDYGRVCHFISEFMREHTYQLLEAAAEHLAEALLMEFSRLRSVSLEIKKPDAPIGLPFGTVSVKIRRGWHTAYLSLGSNLGDREAYLSGAVSALAQDPKNRDVRSSDRILTEPYGYTDQPAFLNAAAVLETLYAPQELLDRLHAIEQAAGRERIVHWGPRTLDLDLLFYEDEIRESPELMIPHPDLPNRMFVLEPLAQLCPGKVHPVLKKTVWQLLRELTEKEERS